MRRRDFISLLGGAAAWSLAGLMISLVPVANLAKAQSYPTRPITLIVAFPPGANIDIVARFLTDRMPSTLGQTVILDHRPGGAGGTVGTKSVADAAPDGYTLLLSPPGALVVAPALYKHLGYDPATSFAPIATLFTSPQLLTVNPAVPANSMQELVAYAKANPGKISFASTESGFPKLQATYWSDVLAPSGTPTSVIRKLSETINAILQSPELQATLDKLNARPKIGTPQDFAAFIAVERQKWTEIVTRAGIKVQ